MKKFLQFAGLISLVLAIVGIILMMACHSLVYENGSVSGWYSGASAIFAKGDYQASIGGFSGTAEFDGKLAWSALLAWIFAIAAIVIVLLGVVLPLLKVKALEKFAGLLNLIAVGLLIVGGIFVFLTKGAFAAANEWDNTNNWSLGGGWVVAAILFILAGVVAVLPAAFDFLGKKK